MSIQHNIFQINRCNNVLHNYFEMDNQQYPIQCARFLLTLTANKLTVSKQASQRDSYQKGMENKPILTTWHQPDHHS